MVSILIAKPITFHIIHKFYMKSRLSTKQNNRLDAEFQSERNIRYGKYHNSFCEIILRVFITSYYSYNHVSCDLLTRNINHLITALEKEWCHLYVQKTYILDWVFILPLSSLFSLRQIAKCHSFWMQMCMLGNIVVVGENSHSLAQPSNILVFLTSPTILSPKYLRKDFKRK